MVFMVVSLRLVPNLVKQLDTRSMQWCISGMPRFVEGCLRLSDETANDRPGQATSVHTVTTS